MSGCVSAPGKAFLIGEYAVLAGTPALVTAVDVRAVARDRRDDDHRDAPSAVVACAQARVAGFLEARGVTVGEPPIVDTGPFHLGPRKLGLGSSAAVAAAVVGHHLARAGLDPADPELADDALGLAMAAHAEAQGGGGSGADVAAAVLGGTLRFVAGKGERVRLPSWLSIGFIDAGQPALTSAFVQSVRKLESNEPARWKAVVARLAHAAATFFEALTTRDPAAAMAAIRSATLEHCGALRELSGHIGAAIVTPPIETILAAAAELGIAAKPSGAGGGDLVVVFADDAGAIDRLGERLRREHGLIRLGDLKADAPGLRADQRIPTVSRLSGFFKLSVTQRRAAVSEATGVPIERMCDLDTGALDVQRANHMIENVVGTLELPLAIATNFRINGIDVLVPMCVEEASVVAAASNAAKMVRAGGGFAAHSDPPWMIAQVQLIRDPGAREAETAAAAVMHARGELLALADGAHPRLVSRGGGAREIEARIVAPDMLVVHVLVDCRDAMGANLLNTVAETVAPHLAQITGWRPGLRILSNLADRRCAHVSARIPPEALVAPGMTGSEVVAGIAAASRFAELDPYRATTHNKGIMNGVDAVVLATGNDWRAMEASAHAFAARSGQYGPLATWRADGEGFLYGAMSLPAAVGIVGGSTRVHPVCALAIEILGCTSSAELGQVMAAVGLASNLAALRAMATEGIQRGHMSLHARSIAVGVGAQGPEVEALALALVADGEIKAERAAALLAELRGRS